MYASEVILHLLLSLEPLVAVLYLTLELVLLDDLQVMYVYLLRRRERRELYLARLHQSFYSTLISEVRTTVYLCGLDL